MAESQPAHATAAAHLSKGDTPQGPSISRFRSLLSRYIRVKVVVVLVALAAVGIFSANLLLGRFIKGLVETHGSRAWGARVTADSISINMLTGRLTVTGFQVANPDNPSQNDFQAKSMTVAVALLPLLSGRLVVRDALVEEPAWRIERTEDGSLHVWESPKQREARKRSILAEEWRKMKDVARQRDWVEEIRRILEKIQAWQEERKAKSREMKPEKRPGRFGTKVEFPALARKPWLLIKSAEVRGMTLALVDQTREQPLPPLRHVQVHLANIAVPPVLAPEPFLVHFSAQVGDDADAQITGDIHADVRAERTKGSGAIEILARGFPLAHFMPLYSESWPVQFRQGTLAAEAKFTIEGEEVEGFVNSTVADVRIAGKPASPQKSEPKKVLGLRPEELNEVLRQAGPLKLSFHVRGPYYALETDLPDAIISLVTDLAKDKGGAIAESLLRERASKKLDRLTEKLEDRLDKRLKGLPGGSDKK